MAAFVALLADGAVAAGQQWPPLAYPPRNGDRRLSIIMKTRADATVALAGALAVSIGGLATLGYAFGAVALVQPFRGVTSMALSWRCASWPAVRR